MSYKRLTNKAEAERSIRNLNILVAVILILIMAVSVLALWLTSVSIDRKNARRTLENIYQKAYFDMAGGMNDVEMKLSKLMIAESKAQKTQLATDIWRTTSTIESNLASLPIDHYAVNNTTKFINQLGDYIYSINRKTIAGQPLTPEEEENLAKLYENCRAVNEGIQKLTQSISQGYKITDHIGTPTQDSKSNVLGSELDTINKTTIDYPKMIYDGPFSDALEDKDYKHLKELEEISPDEGRAYIKKCFEDITAVNYLGEAGGDLKTYEYLCGLKNGYSRYIQLTKKGGLPIMISGNTESSDINIGESESVEIAKEWAKKLIDAELEGVWISASDSVAYINLAPIVNDIVYYPDLIKVKVSLDDGELLGWEANSYMLNHVDRQLPEPQINEEDARTKVSKKIQIDSVRLALIPKDWGTEVLCYEVNGFHNESNYIIYVNAETGEEENILKVINTGNQGNMLM